MGFGHRVYKVRDPRAEVLSKVAESLSSARLEDRKLYDLARHVEQLASRVLEEHKPGATCARTSSSTLRWCCRRSVSSRGSSWRCSPADVLLDGVPTSSSSTLRVV
jgi:hypothetical protein